MGKRTAGQHTGHFVDWLLKRLIRALWLVIALYGLYTAHTFVEDFETVGQRFLDFTKFLHDEALEHDAPANPGTEAPNTEG